MTKTMIRGLAAATLVAAFSGVAVAGAKWGSGVTIDLDSRYAIGGLGASRNSLDTQQYIGCYSYTTPSFNFSVCVAVSASGQVASCQVQSSPANDAMIDAIRSLNGDSYLYFSWDKSGMCTGIQAENFSMYEPKR